MVYGLLASRFFLLFGIHTSVYYILDLPTCDHDSLLFPPRTPEVHRAPFMYYVMMYSVQAGQVAVLLLSLRASPLAQAWLCR